MVLVRRYCLRHPRLPPSSALRAAATSLKREAVESARFARSEGAEKSRSRAVAINTSAPKARKLHSLPLEGGGTPKA